MDEATAVKIVDAIVDDFANRPELEKVWQTIDPFTRDEIKLAWAQIAIDAAQ